jgi:hypothetical protein
MDATSRRVRSLLIPPIVVFTLDHPSGYDESGDAHTEGAGVSRGKRSTPSVSSIDRFSQNLVARKLVNKTATWTVESS